MFEPWKSKSRRVGEGFLVTLIALGIGLLYLAVYLGVIALIVFVVVKVLQATGVV